MCKRNFPRRLDKSSKQQHSGFRRTFSYLSISRPLLNGFLLEPCHTSNTNQWFILGKCNLECIRSRSRHIRTCFIRGGIFFRDQWRILDFSEEAPSYYSANCSWKLHEYEKKMGWFLAPSPRSTTGGGFYPSLRLRWSRAKRVPILEVLWAEVKMGFNSRTGRRPPLPTLGSTMNSMEIF